MNLNAWSLSGCTLIAAAVVWAEPAPVAAQTITDGDTLKQRGVTYRLFTRFSLDYVDQ